MPASVFDQVPSVFDASAFRGRVYGVTGSAHGIGESTVRQLTRLGASVVVMDLDKKNLARVEADLKASNASMLCLWGDVADERFVKRAVRAAHKRWGRIDGWVNNTPYNPGGQPADLPLRELYRTLEVNLVSAWVACGELTPIMEEGGGGSIVNMSSIMAHLTMAGNAAYATAKAAVEGMTRSLAVDLSPSRIRVNAIVPGAINTSYGSKNYRPQPPDVPLSAFNKSNELRQRLREHHWRAGQPWPDQGQARYVADTILFLLSDAARFITGVCLAVDGGAAVSKQNLGALNLNEVARDSKAHKALMEKYPTLRMRYMMGPHWKRLGGRK